MKQRLCLLWLLLTACLCAAAHHLDEQQALQRAQLLLPGKTLTVVSGRSFARSDTRTSDNSFYVFDAEEGGFVIASADDRVPAILGYSDRGRLATDNLPPCIKEWLDSYAEQMAWLRSHPQAAIPRKSTQMSPVSPLLGETAWGQYQPFYNKCPVVNGSHCNTGCVATAMAQIMSYWKWPKQTSCEIPGYYTATMEIDMPSIPVTTIDWDNIIPDYSGRSTAAQREAVSDLMRICGTAMMMDYNPGRSGAIIPKVPDVLPRYFDYASTVVSLNMNCYSNEQWEQMIWRELSEGRPVLFSVTPLKTASHAIVVDGYDGNGYFHVNWGWNGESNGYFLLSILDPEATEGIDAYSSSDGYGCSQSAVIGIQKNEGQQPGSYIAMQVMNVKLPDGDTFYRNSTEEPFLPSISAYIWNARLATVFTFDMGFGLFTTDDQFIGLVGEVYSEELEYGSSIRDFGGRIPIGAGVTEATYKIKPISRISGYSEWLPDEYSATNYVLAEIQDNTLKLTAPFVDLSISLEQVGEVEAGSKGFAKATITNHGTDYVERIHFLLDGKEVGHRQFSVAAGQTSDLYFSFMTRDVGEKTISIATEEYKDGSFVYNILATCVVDVLPSSGIALKGELAVKDAEELVLTSHNAYVVATITNQSKNAFSDSLVVEFSRYDSKERLYLLQQKRRVMVKIAAGETVRVTFPFYGLENGRYRVNLVREEFEEIDGEMEVSVRDELSEMDFTVNTSGQTGVNDASFSEDMMPTSGSDIYTLTGQRMDAAYLKLLKPGIYIYQGKKILLNNR